MKSLGYYNGSFCELEDMYVPMNDRGCYFGDGIYDAAYCYNHKIFALDEHLARFYDGLKITDINIGMKKDELSALIKRLVKRVDDGKLFVYWQATRGTAKRKHEYDGEMRGNVWIMISHGELRDWTKPIKVLTEEDKRHKFCNVKTLNLLPNILALNRAERNGCDEVVFRRNGRITECGHSNVHILKDKTLITPPSDDLILSGICRAHLLNACEKLNIDVECREFYLDELFNADEIILTAAGSLCLDVGEIDGKKVGGKDRENLFKLRNYLIKEFADFTGAEL